MLTCKMKLCSPCLAVPALPVLCLVAIGLATFAAHLDAAGLATRASRLSQCAQSSFRTLFPSRRHTDTFSTTLCLHTASSHPLFFARHDALDTPPLHLVISWALTKRNCVVEVASRCLDTALQPAKSVPLARLLQQASLTLKLSLFRFPTRTSQLASDLRALFCTLAMPRRGLQALLPDRRIVLFAGYATSRKKLVGSSTIETGTCCVGDEDICPASRGDVRAR
ncbi:hypothetical protein L1887_49524 [Cichorium endivia]|nr:hypothetical protein L1887_49524 [Cichorium endivia]